MKMEDVEYLVGGLGVLLLGATFIIMINMFFWEHNIFAKLFAISIDLMCIAGLFHIGNEENE